MKKQQTLMATLIAMVLSPLMSAQTPPDVDVLIGTALASGLDLGINTSGGLTNWLTPEPPPPTPGDLKMVCPGGQQWCAMFITDGPAISSYPRPGLDLSAYKTLIVELEGDPGTTIQIGVKDATQPDDGTETKVTLQVTSNWTTYAIPLSAFAAPVLAHGGYVVNFHNSYVPCEFVFPGGSQPQTLKVRTITYTTAPPVTTMVLPQFVFGGGWYSALYFTNTNGTAVSFQVSFINDNGGPLTVPSAGGSSATINLAPFATTIIEAPNAGPLTDGYVSVALPSGVHGYAVFRQSVAGVPDQEAVVPLSGASATTGMLIWDDTNFTTGVAIVNPSNTPATISVVVYDIHGNMLGTSSLSLGAGNKMAATLRSLPGLSGVAGARGSAYFTAASGNVAVLGLRFYGTAFTSIPAINQ